MQYYQQQGQYFDPASSYGTNYTTTTAETPSATSDHASASSSPRTPINDPGKEFDYYGMVAQQVSFI